MTQVQQLPTKIWDMILSKKNENFCKEVFYSGGRNTWGRSRGGLPGLSKNGFRFISGKGGGVVFPYYPNFTHDREYVNHILFNLPYFGDITEHENWNQFIPFEHFN